LKSSFNYLEKENANNVKGNDRKEMRIETRVGKRPKVSETIVYLHVCLFWPVLSFVLHGAII
jgi:hypothetical protein